MKEDVLVAGDAIVLRRLQPGDLAGFLAYRSDPEVARFQDWPPMDAQQAAGFLQAMSGGPVFRAGHWMQIAVAAHRDHRLLGDMGLFLSADHSIVELGITLSPQAQGQGFARQAMRAAFELVFEGTPATRIVAMTDAENAPSLNLLSSIGMARTATRASEFRGAPCVEVDFALTRQDWDRERGKN